MQKALSTPDIVLDIIAYLPNRSLTALARTSRALSEHALDELWRTMSSLDPLYQTLPAGVWTKLEFNNQPVLARAPINSGDWTRLVSYARRIRALSLGALSRADFLRMIQYHLPRHIELFPNLRSLRLIKNEANAEFFLALSLLLLPSLQSMTIQAASTDCAVATLSHMRFRCSLLEELCITDALGMLPMIDHFVHLQSLVYDNPNDVFDFHVVRSLSRIPNLRKLRVNSRFVSPSPRTDPAPSQRAEQSFPVLTDLTLGPDPVASVASLHAASFLLDMIASPSFRACSLCYSNPEGMSALSTSLARHEHLETLALECTITPQGNAVKMGDLQALSALHGLRDVRLKDVLSHKHTNDIASLARGWPRLRTFHFVCKPWCDDDGSSHQCTVPNVSILAPLSVSCPNLQELRIAFWAIAVGELLSPGIRPRRETPLHLRLCSASSVGDTPDHAYELAEYISDIYPNIDLTYEGSPSSMRWQKCRVQWAEVQRLIRRIGRTRAAERRRVEREVLKAVEDISSGCRLEDKTSANVR